MKEPVETNEYLDKFYKDMEKYAFPMQVYLLNHRFRQHQQMVWSDEDAIQDRTIYEDVIFAKMLNETGQMSDINFRTYVQLFNNMTNFLHRPDVIIYLNVKPEVALERVKKRNRKCENTMSLVYLTQLKKGYEDWLDDIKDRIPVLTLDWDTYQDTKKVKKLVTEFLLHRKGVTL